MGTPLPPFARRKGIPTPYIITPLSKEEATTGKATLIACGDLGVIIAGITKIAPERQDLLTKFEALQTD